MTTHHRYAEGVVVLSAADYDALIQEITTLRERLAENDREELVGKYFRARDSRRMIRVVDTLGADSFLVAFHHPDGRKMYSNEELTYAELAKQYDLDRPL